MPPPPYLDARGNPHRRGMTVEDPPVCSRCRNQPKSVAKLEQLVRAPQVEAESIKVPQNLMDGAASVVSIEAPLDPAANRIRPTGDGTRWMPPWMALLPSRRTSTTCDSPRSSWSRRSSPVSPGKLRPYNCSRFPRQLMAPESGLERGTAGDQMLPLWSATHSVEPATSATKAGTVDLLRTTADESMEDDVTPGIFLRRTSAALKRRYPVRKPSATNSSAASPREACTPIFSQNISRTNTSLVKELSVFFSNRVDEGNLILPSRVSESGVWTKAKLGVSSMKTRGGAAQNCDRCGLDMPDSSSQRRERNCQICKAEMDIPGAWT